MKETGYGLESENPAEAAIMISPEFIRTLMDEYKQKRIVISRNEENIVFESTNPEEVQNAKQVLNKILTRKISYSALEEPTTT